MIPNFNKKRPLQIASVIKKALVEVLQRLGLQYITISEVSMSPDLQYATVFFFPLRLKEKVGEADLQNFLPTIRFKLSKLVKLRYMPEIRFKLDTTFDSFSTIDSLLNNNVKCGDG